MFLVCKVDPARCDRAINSSLQIVLKIVFNVIMYHAQVVWMFPKYNTTRIETELEMWPEKLH